MLSASEPAPGATGVSNVVWGEAMDAAGLWEIEQIKQLKARYFRLMDTKRWAEWADVFTGDCHLHYGDGPDEHVEGRDAIVRHVSGVLGDGVTTHHGHMPEIALTSDRAATGIWSMFDHVRLPGEPARGLEGWGHYEEEYEKGADGRWRIKRLRLTRLRVERFGHW